MEAPRAPGLPRPERAVHLARDGDEGLGPADERPVPLGQRAARVRLQEAQRRRVLEREVVVRRLGALEGLLPERRARVPAKGPLAWSLPGFSTVQ